MRKDKPTTVFTCSVFEVESAIVESERNARQKTYYRLDFPSWVNIVAITPDQQLVMIRQYRFGSDRDELEIPGGAVEQEEDPLDAGLRELREETGYTGEAARIIGRVNPNPALQGNFCYTVLVENARKTTDQDLDEMEDIEVFTMPLASVYRLVRENELSHGLVLNALFSYLLAVDSQYPA